MDDQLNGQSGDNAVANPAGTGVDSNSDSLESAASTTLVEVAPGLAAVFGEVPNGLELLNLDLVPSFDRAELSSVLGSVGTWSTLGGNLVVAAESLQGLYRLDDATMALLQSGAELAFKDGANLGAIFKNGELIAQARLIPAAMTPATAIAAIGPALALAAIESKIDEVSDLVNTNIQLTTQTLKAIRFGQWSELEGLANTMDSTIKEIRELGTITESIWESVAPQRTAVRHQLNLYRLNVDDHIEEIKKLEGRARREYLESNAEAIVFDSNALLTSLKVFAEYEAIRASIARYRGQSDEDEAKQFESIVEKTPAEIETSLTEIQQLTESLVRELRIIAELPGRAAIPFMGRWRESRSTKLTSQQILEAITPLSEKLQSAPCVLGVPEIVCAPEGLELEPYLKILRWFLQRDEELEAVAFAFESRSSRLEGVGRAIIGKRVDAAWDALGARRTSGVAEKFTDGIFISVTNQRVIVADPKDFLREAESVESYNLADVRNVRGRLDRTASIRPSIDVALIKADLHWKFPEAANIEDIDKLAELIAKGPQKVLSATETSAQLEKPSSTDD